MYLQVYDALLMFYIVFTVFILYNYIFKVQKTTILQEALFAFSGLYKPTGIWSLLSVVFFL